MLTTKESIGQLDERITIQSLTTAFDAYGSKTETWADLATVWAKIEYRQNVSDEEYLGARQVERTTVWFTIRWRGDVTPKMRISYGGNYYDIATISKIGRRNYEKLEAELRE